MNPNSTDALVPELENPITQLLHFYQSSDSLSSIEVYHPLPESSQSITVNSAVEQFVHIHGNDSNVTSTAKARPNLPPLPASAVETQQHRTQTTPIARLPRRNWAEGISTPSDTNKDNSMPFHQKPSAISNREKRTTSSNGISPRHMSAHDETESSTRYCDGNRRRMPHQDSGYQPTAHRHKSSTYESSPSANSCEISPKHEKRKPQVAESGLFVKHRGKSRCNQKEVRGMFSLFETIVSVRIPENRDRSVMGCAIVQFETYIYMLNALAEINGKAFNG